MNHNHLPSLSDEELLRRLSELVSHSRRVESDLVAHIAEVDHRQLYAERACSSMFVYCVEVLHLSEPEAYLRITVARIARQFPAILEMLGDGRLHLSGVALLSSHLTKTTAIRCFREPRIGPGDRSRSWWRSSPRNRTLRPSYESSPVLLHCHQTHSVRTGVKIPAFSMPVPQTEPSVSPAAPAPVPIHPAAPKPSPLSPNRFKITFTASGELKEKLERLRALTQKDLVELIEAAVTEKLERLEAKRYGETKKPRKSLADTDTSPKSRYVPVAVRRTIFRKDGKQCTFVDKKGRRCSEREGLEFHHDEPYSLGGDHDPQKIRLLCRRHNFYQAERDYGKGVMDKYRKRGGRVSETAPLYGVHCRTSPGIRNAAETLAYTLTALTKGLGA